MKGKERMGGTGWFLGPLVFGVRKGGEQNEDAASFRVLLKAYRKRKIYQKAVQEKLNN